MNTYQKRIELARYCTGICSECVIGREYAAHACGKNVNFYSRKDDEYIIKDGLIDAYYSLVFNDTKEDNRVVAEVEYVNHPSHYNSGRIEVIDFIEDQKLNFSRGSALKYLCRAGKKNPDKEVEDLEKAAWYINREIERIKKGT